MALPVRRIKLLLLTIGLVLIALIVPVVAMADEEPDPDRYQPGGVGTLFQGVDLKEGQDPTLYEKYSDSAWSTDWKSTGWTHLGDNTVDPVLNGITNFMLGVTRAVTHAGISFSWQMSDFDGFSLLSDEMTDMVGAVADTATGWLLPTAMGIGALIVFIKMGSGTGEALRQFGALALTAMVGLSLAVAPGAWTTTIDAIRQLGSQTAAAATANVTGELETPFAGPDPTFGNDEGVNAHRQQGDAIWRTYVATPWCIAEFGNLNTCEDFGEEVLSRSGDDRIEYIDSDEFKEALGGDKSAAWQMTTGQDGATRMAILLPTLIVAVVFCGLIIFLNGAVLLYLMLALMLLVAGVFFAMMWVIPGRPRQWGMRWIAKLFDFTFMSFIANLVIMVTMFVAMKTMGLTGSLGWAVSSMLTIIASIASVLLFKHLKEIMGVSSTGMMGAMMGGMAATHMGKRAIGGIRKRIPKPGGETAPANPIQRHHGSMQGPNAPRPAHTPSRPGAGRPQSQPAGPSRPGQKTTGGGRRNKQGPMPVPVLAGSPRLPQGPTVTDGHVPGPGDFAHGPGYQFAPPSVPNGSNANIDGAQARAREAARVGAMRQTQSANAPHPGPRATPTTAGSSSPAAPPQPAPPSANTPVKREQATPQPPARPSKPPIATPEATARQTRGEALPGLEGPDNPQPRRRDLRRRDDNR